MGNWISKGIVFLMVIMLTACSGGEGAGEEDIKKAVVLMLLPGLVVEDIETQVSENAGDKVEPKWKARSNIELKFTENFYDKVGKVDDVMVVKVIAEKGDVLTGTVITESELNGQGDWDVSVEKLNIPRVSGFPERMFELNEFVVDGSDEHKELLERVKREKAEEAERKRIAEEKAKKARVAKVSKLRQLMAGPWSAESPLLYDGAIWTDKNGKKLGLDIDIPEGDKSFGEGTLIFYDYESPWIRENLPMTFKVNDDASGLIISIAKSVKFQPVAFTLYNSKNIFFSSEGELRFKNSMFRGNKEYTGHLAKGMNAKNLAKIQRYNELLKSYEIFQTESYMGALPLQKNTYGYFVVKGKNQGTVYGTGKYQKGSSVSAAAVHAGLLKNNELGLLKIISRDVSRCFKNPGTTKNGITSQSRRTCYRAYELELAEKM